MDEIIKEVKNKVIIKMYVLVFYVCGIEFINDFNFGIIFLRILLLNKLLKLLGINDIVILIFIIIGINEIRE